MNDLTVLFNDLLGHFGTRNWWPADCPFEMMIGAVLTQNVSWNNVEMVIARLGLEEILEPEGILETDDTVLHELIRPSGFYRQKAERVKRLASAVIEAGGVDPFLDNDKLRERLLEMNGIGPETADSIALYAGNRPHFVVDAYTMRILERRYGIKGNYRYIQEIFHDSLDRDVELYREFHALLVELAKEHCKATPKCDDCPVSEGCEHFSRR